MLRVKFLGKHYTVVMRIGTCSWKYPEWTDIVYSPDCENYLSEYSRLFSTVEIDQWFWSLFDGGTKLPDSATALDYSASVGEDFRFTIKLPDSLSLTHYRGSGGPLRINPDFLSRSVLEEVLRRLSPIIPKTRVLMFQFEYLNKRKMTGADSFMNLLEDFFSSLPEDIRSENEPWFGVEIRNPQYFSGGFFRLLDRYSISPVLIHGYYLPPAYKTIESFIADIGTKAPVVLRLHGPERKEMDRLSEKKWGRIIRPMDDDLMLIAKAARMLEERGIETIINVNNHYEGCAPLSIGKLRELL